MTEVIGTRTERQGGLNAGRYSNPKFDALLVQGQSETDSVRRNALIGEAMALEKADIAHIPLHQQPIVWAARKGIELRQAPDTVLRLRYVKVP